MKTNISRRTMVKAAAIGAVSSRFFAPHLISAQGSDIELVYWTAFGSGTNGEQQTKIVDEFNAMDNGITITTTAFADYAELANGILTGLDSGDVPNLFTVSEVWWFNLYLRNALADLTPYVDQPEDYVDSLYNEYQRNGGQWAVPFARSTPLLYYNTNAFEEAGVDPAVLGKWSSFAEEAPKLVGGDIQYSFAFPNAASYSAWHLHGAIWAYEGNYSDADFNMLMQEPPAVEAGEFMRDLVQSGGATVVSDSGREFANGSAAVTFISTGAIGWMTTDAQIPWATAELPAELTYGCPTGGAGLAVVANESDEILSAAAEFLAYSTSTDVTAEWAMRTGYLPSRKSTIESDEYSAFLAENPNNAVAVGQLPRTQAQDSARVFIPNGDVTLGNAWEQILVNNVPAQEAFEEAAAILDEDKQPILEALEVIEG